MMKLTCLDAANGSVVWQHDIVNDFKGENVKWQSAASPVIDGDLLFVAGGGPGQSLLAFNKKDGKVVWKTGSETMTHATPTVCEMHGKRQVVFITKSGLISIDVKRGRKLWSFEYPWRTSTAASPVIDGNKVYVSAGYGVGAGLYSVSRTGKVKEVWRKPNRLQNHWSTPILHDGHLYGMFSFKRYGRGPMQCVELATGEVKWSQADYGPGNLIMVGDKLLALSDSGELAVIKATPKAYNELARSKVLGGKCWSTPAYSDGKVYIRSTTEAACVSLVP
jgi:outer membrane protein assembly factor BamB